MKRRFTIISILGVVLLTGLVTSFALAQTSSGERYFDETGHFVRGPFLEFYEKNGGLAVFGFPITDEFVNEDGMLVQYFQRVRFEWHPDAPANRRVRLGKLGVEMGLGQPPLPPHLVPAPNNPYCLYYAQTGHSVCDIFYDFYRKNGGSEVFGHPISSYVIDGDRLTQAFENARFEYYPEDPSNLVRITNLGRVAFDSAGHNPQLLDPRFAGASAPRRVTKLTVRASVMSVVTGRSGNQTIVAFVGNQYGQGLAQASVTAIVHFDSGDQQFTMPFTDANGKTQLVVPFGTTRLGSDVPIDIVVNYGNLKTSTRTSFLPWW